MPSSSPVRNGGELAAAEGRGKSVGRLVGLMLLLRLAALCFAVAAAAFAATDGAALRLAPFRFLLAANAIVAVYSAFEAAAASWEAARGGTLLPEAMQLWFDFGHDQGFGYMALAAAAAAAATATCGGGTSGAERVQGDIAVGLGFAAFASVAAAAFVTGYRLACFLVTGSRSPASPPSSPY
ncbi:CASP-like protein 4C1 [Oryza brachyantha]|uniref:CASP-like protein 4C1 n=1 Tax=Oryza brachyantha TaxID=4533 RepID=UPI001ADD572D|nr:CASP-like protein 4C1 [Oryza brachyantha]